jgi:hypothetical protein
VVDPRQELVELIDLVEEVTARVEALDDTDPSPSPAGTTPEACEERAVRTAGARLAARRAREMREGLDRLRAHARQVAEQARHSGAAARATGTAPTARSGTAWTAVERAGRRLAGLPVNEGEVPGDRILEIVREALPAVGHVDLVALDEQGRPVEAGDRALLETAEADPAAEGSLLVLPLGPGGDGASRTRPGRGRSSWASRTRTRSTPSRRAWSRCRSRCCCPDPAASRGCAVRWRTAT